MNKNRPEECRGLAERNMWHRDGNARPELEHSRGDWHFTQTLKRHFEGKKKGFSVFKLLCGCQSWLLPLQSDVLAFKIDLNNMPGFLLV